MDFVAVFLPLYRVPLSLPGLYEPKWRAQHIIVVSIDLEHKYYRHLNNGYLLVNLILIKYFILNTGHCFK